jgi:hypothetical protein
MILDLIYRSSFSMGRSRICCNWSCSAKIWAKAMKINMVLMKSANVEIPYSNIRTFLHAQELILIFVPLYKLYTLFMITVTHCIPMHMMKQLRHKSVRRAMAIQLIINKE